MKRWIEITTQVGCPNNCWYCPQSTFVKAYTGKKQMTLMDFKKYLKRIPLEVEIHFSGFSEAFFHPDFLSMVEHLNSDHRKVVLYTTLSGFTEEKATQMRQREVLFERVYFHEYDGLGFSMTEFYSKRKLFLDSTLVGSRETIRLTQFSSRAGNLERKWKLFYLEGELRCPTNREQCNVLLPDGRLVLCCNDWGLRHVVGDLNKDNYDSPKVKANRKAILELRKQPCSDLLCRTCETAVKIGGTTDE